MCDAGDHTRPWMLTSAEGQCGGYDFQRTAAGRRSRHRRHRHRFRAYRARPRPRGLRGLDGQCARPGSARHQHHHPLHRRRERRADRSGAGLHRQARHQRQGRKGRRQRGRDQGADRRRHAAGARPAQASIPAFLALEEAGDLPQHAAMVHRDGQGHRRCRQGQVRRHPARPRAAGDLGDAMGAAVGRESHQRHDQQQAGLGDLAPARLGRADRGVRAREGRRLGRNPAGRGRQRAASPTPSSRKAPTPGTWTAPASAFSARHANEAWKKVDDICDVWFDSGSTHAFVLEDPVHFPGPCRHQAQGRRRRRHRDVSGRLGPASRLVPVVAAGKLRHPRPRAVRHRADPRLHARRERPQDVEVGRQHRRAAEGHRAIRRRYPAALGLRHRLCRRPAHRPGNPQEHHRDLPQAAQLDPLDARHAAPLQARRRGRRRRRCPNWSG